MGNSPTQKWITMVTTFTLIHHSYPFNLPDSTYLKTTTTDDYYDIESENTTHTNLDVKIAKETFREVESDFPSISGNVTRGNATFKLEQKDIDEALEYGLKAAKDLYEIKEPLWYSLGLYLDEEHPASRVAAFSAPSTSALKTAKLGYTSLESSKKLRERYPGNVFERSNDRPLQIRTKALEDQCPTIRSRRCTISSKRYRTADGSCNNLKDPWKGSSMMPLQRFLPPRYNDGIQSVRRSVFGQELPSARRVSSTIHRDVNVEMPSITLMFMQWGQFLDHDIVGSAQSRGFNGSVPQCCQKGGFGFLQPELLHPACLPIAVPENDSFLSQFGVRCIEFIRSAPTTQIDCNLGWREQINQVTSFIDASTIYGSDPDRAFAVRLFHNGKLKYNGDLCNSGALTSDCFVPADGRAGEQPGLTAFHTVWLRFHNYVAETLSQLNPQWSDELLFQEARKLVGGFIQHITYREFLPVLLGAEVMDLFELNVLSKGYYEEYDVRTDPTVANSFATAAYRFGHSLVQNSFVRTDSKHTPIFNNVTLHQEPQNMENIWSSGSIDRLLLGFSNQPSQKRDEFLAEELTNHLFQSTNLPFGMDLAAVNIQRGRDHGIAPYTAWREPCGLALIKNWRDLEAIMSLDTVQRFRGIYEHVDDIDLFSGGLAERPVRGGLVGPVFACIIAQQFLNLKKGDRFWYETSDSNAGFTPDQLQQIRRVRFSHVLCKTISGIETIQPFVFLAADATSNVRLPCDSTYLNTLDLTAWTGRDTNTVDVDFDRQRVGKAQKKKRKTRTTTCRSTRTTRYRPTVRPRPLPTRVTTARPTTRVTDRPLQIQITNITTMTVKLDGADPPKRPYFTNYRPYYPNDVTYLFGVVDRTTPAVTVPTPFEVNIKIQYFIPSTTTDLPATRRTKRPNVDNIVTILRPTIDRPFIDRPNDDYNPLPNDDLSYYTTRHPIYNKPYHNYYSTVRYPDYLLQSHNVYATKVDYLVADKPLTNRLTYDKPKFPDKLPESFLYQGERNFVKISSVTRKERADNTFQGDSKEDLLFSKEVPQPFAAKTATLTDVTERRR